ncbi:MAG: DNA gyrase inhibitor YacG [Phycisphaerae bacterium]
MQAFQCVICGKSVSYEPPLPALYPFCSRRCRLIDLGRWFNEQYTIDRDVTPDELASPPPRGDPSDRDS